MTTSFSGQRNISDPAPGRPRPSEETSTSSRLRTVLVVSADGAVRADWARYFEALGMRSLRCVGPQVRCVLLERAHCPLHEDADFAIYDRAALTPELTLKLVRASHALPVAFAADRLDEHGHHEPVISAVASEGADACVGSPISRRVR